jgi:hypothetical protein
VGAAVSPFSAWVSNTVYGVSGIYTRMAVDVSRKRVLTCVQSGAAACQPLFGGVAIAHKQATMRHAEIVGTNQVLQFPKRR